MTLKGFNSVHDATLSNEIQDGLVEFFDWELLQKGNYFNVALNEVAPNGYDYSKLRLANDPHYPSGQIWEGFRSNWVWQSGVAYSPAPLVGSNHTKPGVSGVYVNDVYYPTTTSGTYSHYIDHYNGKVIFNSPIPTTSKVQAEFSYKWINVVYSNDVPWLRQVQLNTSQPNGEFDQKNKGSWNIPPDSRVQLPAIAIEIVPTRRFKPFQLGGGQWVLSDVLFHCLAEDEQTRNKLVDIVSLQSDKIINIIDSNKINVSGVFPLDYRGVPVSGALRYPDLIEAFGGGKLMLTNTTVDRLELIGSDVWGGVVRVTTEGIKLNI